MEVRHDYGAQTAKLGMLTQPKITVVMPSYGKADSNIINVGIQSAKGEAVAITSADDVYSQDDRGSLPSRLRLELRNCITGWRPIACLFLLPVSS